MWTTVGLKGKCGNGFMNCFVIPDYNSINRSPQTESVIDSKNWALLRNRNDFLPKLKFSDSSTKYSALMHFACIVCCDLLPIRSSNVG